MSRETQKPTGWQLPENQQATLRDLMAMSALQQFAHDISWNLSDTECEQIAAASYNLADAMMAERAKRMGVSHE